MLAAASGLATNISTRRASQNQPRKLVALLARADDASAAAPVLPREPSLLLPEAKYFTVHVPFTPADLDAARRSMACHGSQFTAATLQRLLPTVVGVEGQRALRPRRSCLMGDDLFR